MADHRATWARLRDVARQRYPDDDLAAEAAARALFDAEEATSYATDLGARAEEQGVLDTARATTCLRGELWEEQRAEGSSAGGTEEEYVHLNNDDLDYLELPTDEEAVESAAEQRALTVSFETQRSAATRLSDVSWRPREGRRWTTWRRCTEVRANRHISITWRRRTRRGR
jgi:hypothetical protein